MAWGLKKPSLIRWINWLENLNLKSRETNCVFIKQTVSESCSSHICHKFAKMSKSFQLIQFVVIKYIAQCSMLKTSQNDEV
jgi:hypothetical protein